MRTALEIALFFGVIVCSLSTCLIAVAVFKSLPTSYLTIDRAHERWVRLLEPLFNRLYAHSWEEFSAMEESRAEEAGGQTLEDDDEEGGQTLPPRWGTMSRIPRPDAAEEVLLAEDFDDDGEPRRAGA